MRAFTIVFLAATLSAAMAAADGQYSNLPDALKDPAGARVLILDRGKRPMNPSSQNARETP